MHFGFVILHYVTYEMTKTCVDSLLNSFPDENITITIVDNFSNNGSGEKLCTDFALNNKINVLINTSNLGFANGNNVGYHFQKKNINPDFLIVMNNDVVINDHEFLRKVCELYTSTSFAVLGPDIYNPFLNNHQNPERLMPRTPNEIKKRISSLERKCRFPKVYYLLSKMNNIFSNQADIHSRQKIFEEGKDNVILHGACYILSQDFIKARDNCFNPNTFLYHEEDILYLECMRANLKMVYSPLISVKHFEDVSTDASFKSEYKKATMRNKWLLDSAKVLLKVTEQQLIMEE